jgi:hypothetical protein
MQLDAILEVAIGLIFVWLVISVATMETQNRISTLLNWRADYLENSILSMLKDKDLVENFYSHPLIKELHLKDKRGDVLKSRRGKVYRPEYIPKNTFAIAALEVIMNAGKEGDQVPVDSMSINQMADSLKNLAGKNRTLADMTPYLFPKIEQAAENLDEKISQYRKNIENWFNDVMGQTSSLFKIRAQWLAFWIGLVIAVAFNIDTIYIAQKLWQEPTTRAVLVAQAQLEAQGDEPSPALAKVDNLIFPAGWTTTPLEISACGIVGVIGKQVVIRSAGECRAVNGIPALDNGWGFIVKFFGYLLSAAAAAQGAPFWFDILRRLVGVKQQTSQESKG